MLLMPEPVLILPIVLIFLGYWQIQQAKCAILPRPMPKRAARAPLG